MAERTARSIRLAPETWTALEAQAKAERRSVNNLVEVLLEKALYRRLWEDNDATLGEK